MKSVIVTAVGAIIGQGVVRALSQNVAGVRVIAIDANPDSVGFTWADAAYVVPRVADPRWRDALVDICRKEDAALILPTVQVDIDGLVQHGEAIRMACGSFSLVNSPAALRVGFDKWLLEEFCREHKIPTPPTWRADDETAKIVFPALLKPRRGFGGQGIIRVENASELEFWKQRINKGQYLVQTHVGTDNDEYTISTFGYHDGRLAPPFILRRVLKFGTTFEAVPSEDKAMSNIVVELAQALRIVGPTNVQMRMENGKPYIIEVNPRFSSASSIRHAFGFSEAIMAVQSFAMGTIILPQPKFHGKCVRYIADHYFWR